MHTFVESTEQQAHGLHSRFSRPHTDLDRQRCRRSPARFIALFHPCYSLFGREGPVHQTCQKLPEHVAYSEHRRVLLVPWQDLSLWPLWPLSFGLRSFGLMAYFVLSACPGFYSSSSSSCLWKVACTIQASQDRPLFFSNYCVLAALDEEATFCRYHLCWMPCAPRGLAWQQRGHSSDVSSKVSLVSIFADTWPGAHRASLLKFRSLCHTGFEMSCSQVHGRDRCGHEEFLALPPGGVTQKDVYLSWPLVSSCGRR